MENNYFETKKYRCLIEHGHFLSEEFYLTMCGVESCLPGKRFGPARREDYHLHVILSGRGVLEVDGRRLELHVGQLFIQKPGEVTCYYADAENPWTYSWMDFGGTLAPRMAAAAGFSEGVNTVDCNIDPMRFYRLVDVALSHPALSLGGRLRRYGLLNQFLALAVESAAATHEGRDRQNFFARGSDDYMLYALDFIRRNYAAISVMDIANYLGISRSHLTRLFKASLGCSPREYLNRLRMRRSAWLLANTSMSVQEISGSVGYEDQLTFSKAFKKAYDVSPRYYRELPDEERKVLGDIESIPGADDPIL